MTLKTICATLLALVCLSQASPIRVRSGSGKLSTMDKTILNYALTLEHLENAFYSEALTKFDEAAFEAAGFAPLVRQRYAEIATHETEHVSFLSSVLGPDATQPCTYNFPYSDPQSFGSLSLILEGVGVSAYTGAAQAIASKLVLTAAASVLSTEARHASWIASAVTGADPFPSSFDTPLDMSQVFSLAAPFIASCPSTNPTLPVTQFPVLSVSPAAPTVGATITLSFDASVDRPLYLALLSGLTTTFIEIQNDKTAVLPGNLVGTVYGVVTTSNTVVSDDVTVAGPVIMQIPQPRKF